MQHFTHFSDTVKSHLFFTGKDKFFFESQRWRGRYIRQAVGYLRKYQQEWWQQFNESNQTQCHRDGTEVIIIVFVSCCPIPFVFVHIVHALWARCLFVLAFHRNNYFYHFPILCLIFFASPPASPSPHKGPQSPNKASNSKNNNSAQKSKAPPTQYRSRINEYYRTTLTGRDLWKKRTNKVNCGWVSESKQFCCG